jgi:uncharacterized membrane-anchored protein
MGIVLATPHLRPRCAPQLQGKNHMRHLLSVLLGLLALVSISLALPAQAQEAAEKRDPIDELPWQAGPSKGAIGNRATIDVPTGYLFLDAAGTRQLNELLENPPSGTEEYTLTPKSMDWLAFFSFSDVGYVKDDESLDADSILQTVREGTEQSNVERSKRGWEELRIVGWSFKPQYDKQMKALEWAIVAESEQSKNQVVNYNTRLLGRSGVMEVVVATGPEELNASIADFKRLVPGYSFVPGETYAEFKAGDHVAEYGLAALITGGAAAVASKKGLFAVIGAFLLKGWKLVMIGLLAVGAVVRKLFSRGDRNPGA